MPAMTAFGGKTKTVFLNEAESHKLHIAFTVAPGETIIKGQPVKLDDEGNVVAAEATAAAADATLIIGYSIHNGAEGEEVTIAMKGYATVFAMSAAALDAGPVKYAGVNATDGFYTNYTSAAADTTQMNGWALDQATAANELIRVVVKS